MKSRIKPNSSESEKEATSGRKLLVLQLQISQRSTTDESIPQFAEYVGTLLKGVADFDHMYLAAYDSTKDVLTFPYCDDPNEELQPVARDALDTPLRNVMQSGEATYLELGDYEQGIRDGTICDRDPIPHVWLGVPLKHGGDTFAVLVFLAYRDYNSKISDFNPILDLANSLASAFHAKYKLTGLIQSERKFRHFVEASTDVTFQVTRSGYIDFVSSNVKQLFGCDPDMIVGKHFKSTTPITQVSKVIAALNRISKGETVLNLEIDQKLGSGEQVPMEVNASPVFRGDRVIGASGTMRDITERKQARKEIERLAFFPTANPMPVVEVDLLGTPSYINPAGIKLLDNMNLDMSQVSRILPQRYKQAIREALSTGNEIQAQEVSLENLQLLWSAHFLQNQELVHFYATDITTLKEAESELIEAKESAVQSERVKSLFLANMSHEIRTPLNSILGFTEMLEMEAQDKLGEDAGTYFDIIRSSGKRLYRTVHEILDISQIETGTFDLKLDEVNLSKVLRDLCESSSQDAVGKGLTFEAHIPENDIIVEADEYCTSQALSNLLDNAVKYTDEGNISISARSLDHGVQVIIHDSGIGMSQEYQDRMYDPFSQESDGYTKKFQGVGLGLALTKRYLDLIQARLDLESEKGKGSKFTITFKHAQADDHEGGEQASMTTDNHTEVTLERQTILVVEDDPNSQKLAGFTLKKDYEVCFAASVAEAKRVLGDHDVSLILLDLSLAGDEDGLDLARWLRSEQKWVETPVIALTAHAFTSDRERCIEAGCTDFLTKPFRRTQLLEKIDTLL